MAEKISIARLAMEMQAYKTPSGFAVIARQIRMALIDGRKHDWGDVAVGSDIPVVCAYPEDLADRLGIPVCEELAEYASRIAA